MHFTEKSHDKTSVLWGITVDRHVTCMSLCHRVSLDVVIPLATAGVAEEESKNYCCNPACELSAGMINSWFIFFEEHNSSEISGNLCKQEHILKI